MPLFGIFLVALVLIVYRSLRALGAIIVTLGSVVAIAVGLAAIFGWSNTVVSTLVPTDRDGHDDRDPGLHPFEIHGAGRRSDPARNTTRARSPTNS